MTMLTLGGIWTDDNKLRRVFSWLTRIGAAPKFGRRPIGWYQQDQCKAIEKLENCMVLNHIERTSPIRFNHGQIQAKHNGRWIPFARLILGEIVPQ